MGRAIVIDDQYTLKVFKYETVQLRLHLFPPRRGEKGKKLRSSPSPPASPRGRGDLGNTGLEVFDFQPDSSSRQLRVALTESPGRSEPGSHVSRVLGRQLGLKTSEQLGAWVLRGMGFAISSGSSAPYGLGEPGHVTEPLRSHCGHICKMGQMTRSSQGRCAEQR